jgi:hypothetical protein
MLVRLCIFALRDSAFFGELHFPDFLRCLFPDSSVSVLWQSLRWLNVRSMVWSWTSRFITTFYQV